MSGTLHSIFGCLPWHTDASATGRVFTRDGEEVARVAFIRGDPRISMQREESIAKLIAAAPEMLAAIRAAEDLLTRCDAELLPGNLKPATDEDWDHVHTRLRAVIEAVDPVSHAVAA